MEFENIAYNKPVMCSLCGGRMIFKGVGEYRCEECKNIEYDDYGKVRCYIEQHRGATAADIEAAIGVKQKTIRQMLKDSKLEVSSNSKAFLKCEICGVDIRLGRYCTACEAKKLQHDGEERKKKASMNIKGVGMGKQAEDGEKRFRRK